MRDLPPLTEIIAEIRAECTFAFERAGSTAADDWVRRYSDEVRASCARLEACVGARITPHKGRVTIAGITATSEAGIAQALRNWITAAEKREAAHG